MKTANIQGFSMVEVTFALGIATFCLVTLLAVLPVGLNSNRHSVGQTEAAGIATEVEADLRAALIDQKSPRFKLIPDSLDTAQTIFFDLNGRVVSTVDGAVYRTSIVFHRPSGSPVKWVRLLVSWPAPVDPLDPASAKNTAGVFETCTAIKP